MTWRENRKLVFIQHETSLRRGKWIELVMAGKSDERIPYLVTPHRHNQTYDDTVWTLGRLVPVIKDCRDWRYFRRWENINCSVEHSIILSLSKVTDAIAALHGYIKRDFQFKSCGYLRIDTTALFYSPHLHPFYSTCLYYLAPSGRKLDIVKRKTSYSRGEGTEVQWSSLLPWWLCPIVHHSRWSRNPRSHPEKEIPCPVQPSHRVCIQHLLQTGIIVVNSNREMEENWIENKPIARETANCPLTR